MVDTAAPQQTNAQLAATNTGTAGYDYTADPYYQSASVGTKTYLDKQNQQDLYNKALGQAGQDWLKGRDPYYSELQKSVYNAQAPGIQQQYADTLKSQSLQAASQGLQKGSQDTYAKNRLATTEQAQLGQADIQGQAAAQQAQAQDQQLVNQWLQFMQGQGQNTLAAYAQGQQSAASNQAQIANAYQQFQMNANSLDQQRSAQTSQMYGGMLTQAGSGAGGLTKLFMGG